MLKWMEKGSEKQDKCNKDDSKLPIEKSELGLIEAHGQGQQQPIAAIC